MIGEHLRSSMDHCARLTRARARNFYFGLKLTPEPRRSALYALYAWTRRADDSVDDAPSEPAARRAIEEFRALTRGVLDRTGERSAPDRDPMWPAVAWTLTSYPIRPEWLWSMLDGMEEDFQHRGYEDFAGLERYCARVASTVGQMCVAVWGLAPGVDAGIAYDLAHRRGIAFQLTNILRDLRADFAQTPSRVYLPRCVLWEHRLTVEELCAWSDPERCAACVGSIVVRAREAYEESEPLHAMIDPDCRASLLAMTRIYRGLLGVFERDPSRVSGPVPARLTTARKLSIALSALWSAQTGPRHGASVP